MAGSLAAKTTNLICSYYNEKFEQWTKLDCPAAYHNTVTEDRVHCCSTHLTEFGVINQEYYISKYSRMIQHILISIVPSVLIFVTVFVSTLVALCFLKRKPVSSDEKPESQRRIQEENDPSVIGVTCQNIIVDDALKIHQTPCSEKLETESNMKDEDLSVVSRRNYVNDLQRT